jgi:hypothetical protein
MLVGKLNAYGTGTSRECLELTARDCALYSASVRKHEPTAAAASPGVHWGRGLVGTLEQVPRFALLVTAALILLMLPARADVLITIDKSAHLIEV